MDVPSQHSMQRTKFTLRGALQVNRSGLILQYSKMRDARCGTVRTRFSSAFPAEEAQFNASQARAISEKEIDEDDDWLMFLVPVTDPIGDFDPYDAPGG